MCGLPALRAIIIYITVNIICILYTVYIIIYMYMIIGIYNTLYIIYIMYLPDAKAGLLAIQ